MLQLGPGRYTFEVVNCGTGPIASDQAPEIEGMSVPPTAERVWGLYGNGHDKGALFTVALTEYRSRVGDGPVTITQSALIRMDVPADTNVAASTTLPPPSSSLPGTGPSAAPTTTPEAVEHLGLTAQRFRQEAATSWIDPRDKDATDALVKIDGATYVMAGEFGPTGSDSASTATESGQITARCPDKPTS